jgi:hypothetical protein
MNPAINNSIRHALPMEAAGAACAHAYEYAHTYTGAIDARVVDLSGIWSCLSFDMLRTMTIQGDPGSSG